MNSIWGIVPSVLGLGLLLFALWLTTIIQKTEYVVSYVDIATIVGSVITGTLSWCFGLLIISKVLSI